jgi:hypothetical protein
MGEGGVPENLHVSLYFDVHVYWGSCGMFVVFVACFRVAIGLCRLGSDVCTVIIS